MKFLLFLLSTALFASTSASSSFRSLGELDQTTPNDPTPTPPDWSVCAFDLSTHCPSLPTGPGDRHAAFDCLVSHYDQLSDDCQVFLQLSPRYACKNDAELFCPSQWSSGDMKAVKTCLLSHRSELSQLCITAIQHRSPTSVPTSPSSSSSSSSGDGSVCNNDATTYCPAFPNIPNTDRHELFDCLVSHLSSLSNQCRSWIQSTPKYACKGDAELYCPSELASHDMESLKACLLSHKDQLSQQCTNSILHRPTMMPTSPSSSSSVDWSVCNADSTTFCPTFPNVPGNRHGLFDCLVSNLDQLTQDCHNFIQTSPRYACASDAQLYCPSEWSSGDMKSVQACLKLHVSQLSTKCIAAANTRPEWNMPTSSSSSNKDEISSSDSSSMSTSKTNVMIGLGVVGAICILVSVLVCVYMKIRNNNNQHRYSKTYTNDNNIGLVSASATYVRIDQDNVVRNV